MAKRVDNIVLRINNGTDLAPHALAPYPDNPPPQGSSPTPQISVYELTILQALLTAPSASTSSVLRRR